jgi:ribose 5-phosphate isomerase A
MRERMAPAGTACQLARGPRTWKGRGARDTFEPTSTPPPTRKRALKALDAEALKRHAAEAALAHVESGMVLGLGTGSTVAHLLDLLGGALAAGSLTDIVGVPTSVQTERHAGRLGIPLVGLADRARIDLTIDGADEVSPELDLIKGAGGALLREKMVAQASDRLLIIADQRKVVERLGTVCPLPVEVVSWGWQAHVDFLRGWGGEVTMRRGEDGRPVLSDNGQLFLDCRFHGGIGDPAALDGALAARAGVVESGLFLGLAQEALIASAKGVERVRRGR